MNRCASYTIRHVGSAESSALALQWTRKMQYFFGIWVSQGLHRCTYTAGDLQASDPDAEWALYVCKLGLLAAQHGLGQRSWTARLPWKLVGIVL